MRKISAVVLTVCIFCMCGAFSVSPNENTTHTYTISTDDKWIQTQDAYLPGNIYMRDMGLSAPEDIFINNGAICSLMTASGSAGYAIYRNKESAKIAYYNLKDKYRTYFATSYNSKKNRPF